MSKAERLDDEIERPVKTKVSNRTREKRKRFFGVFWGTTSPTARANKKGDGYHPHATS